MYKFHILIAVESKVHMSPIFLGVLSPAYVGALLHFLDIVVGVVANILQFPTDSIGDQEVLLRLSRLHEYLHLSNCFGLTLIFLHLHKLLLVPGLVSVLVYHLTVANDMREKGRCLVLLQ